MSHHHHDHEIKSEMTFEVKLAKLISHWIKHNKDHAKTYKEWVKRAEDNGMEETAKVLSEAAELTLLINQKLNDASG